METVTNLVLLVVAVWGVLAISVRATWMQGRVAGIASLILSLAAVTASATVPTMSSAGQFGLAITGVTAATFTGWPVTAAVLQTALQIPPQEQNARLPATGWIGLAERFGFALALVIDLPEVAAILIGVKALGMYSSPRKSDHPRNALQASRVLGTMVSVAWALLAVAPFLISR